MAVLVLYPVDSDQYLWLSEALQCVIRVEIVKDKKTKATAHDERDRIVELAFERGLLILGAGENSIRLAPPLIVTQEQADIAMDILEECIGIVEKVS